MQKTKRLADWLWWLTMGMSLLIVAGVCRSTVQAASEIAARQQPARSAPQIDVRPLHPGISLHRELTGGVEHHYQVSLAAGQQVRFQIVKQGVDITLAVKSPAAEDLFSANLEAREQGVESLLLMAQTAGLHTLIVKWAYPQAPLGRYQLTADEWREATIEDQQRFAAQQTFVEGVTLFEKQTAEAQGEALRKLSASLASWQAIGDPQWQGRVEYWLGWILHGLNQQAKALEHLNRALALRRAAGDATGEAEALRTIGMAYMAQGKPQPALDHFKQALTIQQGLAERGQLAFTYSQLAAIYWRTGEPVKAKEYFELGFASLREIGDVRNEARLRTSHSFVYMTQGDYQEAYQPLPRTLEIFREIKDLDGEAHALNTLGTVVYNLGEMEKAREHFRESLAIFRQLAYKRNQAHLLTNLGITYIGTPDDTLADKQEALRYFNDALALTSNDPRSEANLLRFIGQAYLEMGKVSEALLYFNRALELAKKQQDPSAEARARKSLGDVYTLTGDYQQALAHLEVSLRLRRQVKEQQGIAQTLFMLARVERARGELHKALAYLEEGLQIVELRREKIFGNELRTSYFANNQGFYELYIDVLMRLHKEQPQAGYDGLALQASERARARGLLDLFSEAGVDIRQDVEPTLLHREARLIQQLNDLEKRRAQVLSRQHTDEEADAVERPAAVVLERLRQLEAQIRAVSPQYAALTRPQPVNLKELQAQLDEDTVLLVYRLGTARSVLWTVTPTGLQGYELPARAEIESAAAQVRSRLTDRELNEKKYRQSWPQTEVFIKHLSRLILQPAARHLTAKRLVVVADGALHFIPFGMLIAPHNGQLLSAAHEIIHLPSVSVLKQLRQQAPMRAVAPKMLALIADPVFEKDDERLRNLQEKGKPLAISLSQRDDSLSSLKRALENNKPLERLKASEYEAQQISRYVPETQYEMFLGFSASRANLAKTDLSRFRILHFATHHLVNPKRPELSGIVLSLYDRDGQPQNGFLLAHEFYPLKLNAELVVLSACQTAIGRQLRGEGLISLTRSLMYAGARRLVVSLWDAPDEATAELMSQFYAQMLRYQLHPAAALRAAQLVMSRHPRWSAPYYWAGFVLQGEWR